MSTDPPIRWLCHPLDANTQSYGDGERLQVESTSSIEAGDTANTVRLTLPNHIGTHIDLPLHFFDPAPSLDSVPPEGWWFASVQLVEFEGPLDGLIGIDSLSAAVDPECELLLIRTGHQSTRGTDAWWSAGPGVSAELGSWLRAHRPSVRAIGLDTISVTSRLHREEGRAAHRSLLDPDAPGDPVLPIEDMDLSGITPSDLGAVLVSPLRVRGADGVPVTVWAFPPTAGPPVR